MKFCKRQSSRPMTKAPATLWTEFCRFLLCGVGCFSLCAAAGGVLEDYPLTGLIIGALIGLVFIAVGLFANPGTVEKLTEGINF